MLQYIIPILFVTFLTAGWVGVQLLARKMKTKNHFDDLDSSTCGQCTCNGSGDNCATDAHHR
jgi:hypothetical protein